MGRIDIRPSNKPVTAPAPERSQALCPPDAPSSPQSPVWVVLRVLLGVVIGLMILREMNAGAKRRVTSMHHLLNVGGLVGPAAGEPPLQLGNDSAVEVTRNRLFYDPVPADVVFANLPPNFQRANVEYDHGVIYSWGPNRTYRMKRGELSARVLQRDSYNSNQPPCLRSRLRCPRSSRVPICTFTVARNVAHQPRPST